MKQILASATQYYYESLSSPHGDEARKFLKMRGIYKDTTIKYSLGTSYSLYGLYFYLKNYFSEEEMIKSGLLKSSLKEPYKLKDTFKDYVTIPILKKGLPVSFTSRNIKKNSNFPHKHLQGEIEYLFNEDLLDKYNSLIISEKPIDCMILNQANLPSVSCFGANSFKAKHAFKFLNKSSIYILFDNDINKAGIKGALEVAWLLFDLQKINARIVTLPIIGDVNDLWLLSKKDFRFLIQKAMAKAQSYTEFHEHFNSHVKNKLKNEKKILRKYATLDDIKSTKISLIIEKFVPIYKVGDNCYKALCPFHKDKKTLSLFIYNKTGTFKCFGCDIWGDSIEFVKKIKNINFNEAIEFIRKEFINDR